MMVTDRRRMADDSALVRTVREAAQAGLDDLQIREKDLGGRALFDLVCRLRDAAAGTALRLVVNSRVDVASAAGIPGVQLPEEGLPVTDVKCAFPDLQVGASRHTRDGVVEAAAQGADFVVLGPVFATPGKEDRALGLPAFAAAARAVTVPVYAIGGVDVGRAAALVAAGASGIALLRPFLSAPPAPTIAAFRAALA
jgi:thiamine-phosphate diphosphorylase